MINEFKLIFVFWNLFVTKHFSILERLKHKIRHSKFWTMIHFEHRLCSWPKFNRNAEKTLELHLKKGKSASIHNNDQLLLLRTLPRQSRVLEFHQMFVQYFQWCRTHQILFFHFISFDYLPKCLAYLVVNHRNWNIIKKNRNVWHSEDGIWL